MQCKGININGRHHTIIKERVCGCIVSGIAQDNFTKEVNYFSYYRRVNEFIPL